MVIDAAAALGEQATGKDTLVCYSMHATKGFGIGEGGLVVMPTVELADQARQLSNFGFNKGVIFQAGSNYKLSEYHAAIGMAQIKRISILNKRRQAVRMHFRPWIKRLLPYFDVQTVNQVVSHPDDDNVVGFQPFGFRSAVALKFKPEYEAALELISSILMENEVGVRRWYNPVLHTHEAFVRCTTINPNGSSRLDFTESLNRSLLGLPFHNFLTRSEVDYFCELIINSVVELYGLNKLSIHHSNN